MNSETVGTAWQRFFHPSRGKPRVGKVVLPPPSKAVEQSTEYPPAPAKVLVSWTSDFELPSIKHHRDSFR